MTGEPPAADHRAVLAALRLRAQRLAGDRFVSPADMVRAFGAVQSQDYGAAKWAVGQRVAGAVDADLDRLVDDGHILRTHVLRPTWHFVHPDDARWMLELTGPRVRSGLRARHRELGVDEDLVARAHAVFRRALAGGDHRTRDELSVALQAAGMRVDGPVTSHLLLTAELDRLVISGRRSGKRHTYALFDERVPAAPALDRADAVGRLAQRYFTSHGPAQLADFVWWSGLNLGDARAGVAHAGASLAHRREQGVDYWLDATLADSPPPRAAHLLPNFDEYCVAYRDRSAALDPALPFDHALFSFGSILSNVVTVGGRVRGSWRRRAAAGGELVEVALLPGAPEADRAAIVAAGAELAAFLCKAVTVTVTQGTGSPGADPGREA